MNHYFSVRKRGLALFAALMMCLSLLPGTAYAAGGAVGDICPDCKETIRVDIEGDKHVVWCYCPIDFTLVDHTFSNGSCTVCGAADPNYTGDAGNTHTCTYDEYDHCKECGKLNPQHTHNFGENGKCMCGEEQHTHSFTSWRMDFSNYNQHLAKCATCGQEIPEKHDFHSQYGYVSCKCGYGYYEDAVTGHTHNWSAWTHNEKDGLDIHERYCTIPECGETQTDECKLEAVDGGAKVMCQTCGYVKYNDGTPGTNPGDGSCAHVWSATGTNIGEGLHRLTCLKCRETKDDGCSLQILNRADGQPGAYYCSICGYQVPIRADDQQYCKDEEAHDWQVKDDVLSQDGKSVLTTWECSTCGKVLIQDICNSPVTVTVRCVDEDGNKVHESIVKPIIKGGDYEITSPTVSGYVPDKTVVKGTGASENVVETVTYRKVETPVKYPLTIKYEYEGGAEAHAPYTAMLANGEEYRVESPTIPNHVPEWSVVEGKMPGADELITVKYTRIYTVTVHYVYADGSQAAEKSVLTNLEKGNAYSVTSPTIAGYTASERVVSGSIIDDDVVVTVTYTPDAPETPETPATYTVTIRYQFADGSEAAADYVRTGLADNASYSVTSPAIEGYTASQSVVSGSISGGNVVVTVIYTAVTGGDPAPVTPAPTPDDDDVTPPVITITDGTTPLASVTIEDEDVPLAGTVGLNTVDHFAYIIGYGDNTVRPLDNISRAEAVTIFFRLMTDEFREANWSTTNTFADVNAGNWYNNAISTCQKAGALAAFDQDANFLPDQAITRAEFAALAAGFISDEYTGETVGDFSDTEGHWAAAYIRKAVEAGWIAGIGGVFRPDEPITRADVMTMVNRMLDRVPDAGHMLPDMITWIDNPEGTSYYEDVQEATNEHAYERDELGITEIWTELLVMRDWEALEKEWADANA